MKSLWTSTLTILTIVFFLKACTMTKNNIYQLTKNYQPDNQQLYDTIVHLDSAFFGAYNTCETNLEKYASFYSEDIEFYHDQGGLMTSKKDIIESTKRNVCGRVTRELIKGSIEVYPIKDFGAVEFGLHTFYNNQDPAPNHSKVGRFTILWKLENNQWKITRAISLH